MPLLLALDTATDRPTMALGTAEDPGSEVGVSDRRDLSRDIDQLVKRLLTSRGVRASELVGILVADGPGSFTGLRIGAAFAKGLCRAWSLPLFTAPSMMGAAWKASQPRSRAAAQSISVEYDALRGDVYRAVYRFGRSRVEIVEPPAVTRRAAAPNGAADERHASAAALLSMLGVPGGPAQAADAASWEPVYGRPAEAEARRLARDARL